MRLQVIQDDYGQNTGVFVPIHDWYELIEKHEDLKELVNITNTPKQKLSDLAGKLSSETAEEMHNYITKSRDEWDNRINEQL